MSDKGGSGDAPFDDDGMDNSTFNPSVDEWRIVARILIAAAYCGLIGFEREYKKKTAASVKMHMIVGAGAACYVGTSAINTSGTFSSACQN